jgi:hypothetical protein
MTINKFDLNLILISINKLKPYRFIEDQTLQLVLVKPNDFLSKEPMEVKYSNNLQHVEETHFDNMSDDELV